MSRAEGHGWGIRYKAGTDLAERWGDGLCGDFATREEAERVVSRAANGEHMEVCEVDAS